MFRDPDSIHANQALIQRAHDMIEELDLLRAKAVVAGALKEDEGTREIGPLLVALRAAGARENEGRLTPE